MPDTGLAALAASARAEGAAVRTVRSVSIVAANSSTRMICASSGRSLRAPNTWARRSTTVFGTTVVISDEAFYVDGVPQPALPAAGALGPLLLRLALERGRRALGRLQRAASFIDLDEVALAARDRLRRLVARRVELDLDPAGRSLRDDARAAVVQGGDARRRRGPRRAAPARQRRPTYGGRSWPPPPLLVVSPPNAH